MKKISAFTKPVDQVHLDKFGHQIYFKKRPADTYRAARRNAGKVLRKQTEK